MERLTTRRRFLTRSARAAGAAGLAALALPDSLKAAPSERVRVAVMGVRGRGAGLLQGFASMKDVEVAAICDVDTRLFGKALQSVAGRQAKEPETEKDFRRLIDRKDIDALVIGTPDHWHAIPTVLACQAGKDVYVEKPDAHNLLEGKAMVEAARKHRRVVQLGTQSRSGAHFHQAVAYARSGKLGKVCLAKGWSSQRRGDIGKKKDQPAPPAGVDYDMWTGPAPLKPFNENRFHSTWHWRFDFGTGDLGNDGVHRIDIARWAAGVGWPTAVSSSGGKHFFDDDQEWPDSQYTVWDYPGFTLVYEMRLWSRYPQDGLEEGAAVYGENAYLVMGHHGWKVFGEGGKLIEEHGGSEMELAHRQDFIDCTKSRRAPAAGIEEGHLSSALCHMGNIAWRLGRKLRFDPATESFPGDEEANRLLGREYRAPWTLPSPV